jgi:hypothetical protein
MRCTRARCVAPSFVAEREHHIDRAFLFLAMATPIVCSPLPPRLRTTSLPVAAVSHQIPPFNEQANVQAVSSDIAVLLADWTEEAMRPQSAASREYPVARIDRAIDQYLAELEPGRMETRAVYDGVKRRIRTYW